MSEKFHYHLVILATGFQNVRYVYIKGKIRTLTKKDIDMCFERTKTTIEDGVYRIDSINYLGYMDKYFFENGTSEPDAWLEYTANQHIDHMSLGCLVALKITEGFFGTEVKGKIVGFKINRRDKKILELQLTDNKSKRSILLTNISHYKVITDMEFKSE